MYACVYCIYKTLLFKLKESEKLLTDNKLSKMHGPCVQQLDKVLNALNVQRQAFHSGSFIGNHVHKMLIVSF